VRILGIDIETAPNKAFVWGLWKQTVSLSQLIQSGRVMCFAWRWYDRSVEDSPVQFISEVGGARAHERMVRKAHALLTEADAAVHYNGTSFDVPTLNKEFVKLGLGPPAPFAQIDLLQTARKKFRFTSNKMAHLLAQLGIEEKLDHSGFRLWIGCMDGDPDAWKEMEEYNRRDVSSMERLYEILLPWISNHPNHALYQADNLGDQMCPSCGGIDLQRRGLQRTKVMVYQRFHCQDCGSWSRGRKTSLTNYERRGVVSSI
jgi:predicted RNA-binding Zn-ribbon protein involved in translation (DUF1610 family)